MFKNVGLFVIMLSLLTSCAEKKDCKCAVISKRLDVETISHAVQIFVMDTFSVSNIIVVDNIDSVEWYNKYILFYDNHNEIMGCVYTETFIDSIHEGCVYFTDSMQKHKLKGKCVWPYAIPKKSLPYVPQSITTYDVGIARDYYIKDSSIFFIFNAYDKSMPIEDLERKATMFYIDTDEYAKTDTISSRISEIIFDLSFASAQLTSFSL